MPGRDSRGPPELMAPTSPVVPGQRQRSASPLPRERSAPGRPTGRDPAEGTRARLAVPTRRGTGATWRTAAWFHFSGAFPNTRRCSESKVQTHLHLTHVRCRTGYLARSRDVHRRVGQAQVRVIESIEVFPAEL